MSHIVLDIVMSNSDLKRYNIRWIVIMHADIFTRTGYQNNASSRFVLLLIVMITDSFFTWRDNN